MHWLFLFLLIDSGSGTFGGHALLQLEPDQIVRARLRLRIADSLRVGNVFPGEVGRYTGILSRRNRLGEKKVVMSDVASVACPGNGNFFAIARQVSGIVLCDTTGVEQHDACVFLFNSAILKMHGFGSVCELGIIHVPGRHG